MFCNNTIITSLFFSHVPFMCFHGHFIKSVFLVTTTIAIIPGNRPHSVITCLKNFIWPTKEQVSEAATGVSEQSTAVWVSGVSGASEWTLYKRDCHVKKQAPNVFFSPFFYASLCKKQSCQNSSEVHCTCTFCHPELFLVIIYTNAIADFVFLKMLYIKSQVLCHPLIASLMRDRLNRNKVGLTKGNQREVLW